MYTTGWKAGYLAGRKSLPQAHARTAATRHQIWEVGYKAGYKAGAAARDALGY